MKKCIITFVLLQCCLLLNGCTDNTKKNHSITKSHKEPPNDQKIEKPDLGDTLFLGFRVNMDLDQIKNKVEQLIKNGTLETTGGVAYAYRFYTDKQNFKLFLNFFSKGNQIYLEENQNEARLDEILLVESECFDEIGYDGITREVGECFEVSFREKLLQLYLSKYKFQKNNKVLKNQKILRWLTEEEKEMEKRKPRVKFEQRERRKPGIQLAGMKEIQLPNGKSILYYNREKGISIKCNYGFSEKNVRTIQFQKIEIRYLSNKRLDDQIESFNEYRKVKVEDLPMSKSEVERIKAKKKEVFENI